MPTFLVTGFEPFYIHKHNPSALAAEHVSETAYRNWHTEHLILPVEPHRAGKILAETITEKQPDGVLLIGLSARAAHMTLERVAVNVMDFAIPDNDGQQYTDTPIDEDGADAFLSTLPLRPILAAWREAGIPGKISNSAGLYVCNSLFYRGRLTLERLGRSEVPCGFLHVPANGDVALNTDKELPYLPQSEINRATLIAAQSIMDMVDQTNKTNKQL